MSWPLALTVVTGKVRELFSEWTNADDRGCRKDTRRHGRHARALDRGSRDLSAARPHLVRRPGCPSRLLPRGVRRQAAMARRSHLRRHRCPLPVPARSRFQPGRHCHRPVAGRLRWRLCGLDGFHLALGHCPRGLCLRRRCAGRPRRFRLAARTESRGRGRRCPGGAGDDAHADARSRPGNGCRRHGRCHPGAAVGLDPRRHDPGGRHRRDFTAARRGTDRSCLVAVANKSARGRRLSGHLLRPAGGLAPGRRRDLLAWHRAVRCFLSRGVAGVRRRACDPAAAAGGGRAARLGQQRPLPRGLWRRPGRAPAR